MSRHALMFAAVAVLFCPAAAVLAQTGSVDFQGPSSLVHGGALSAGDLLLPTPPAPGPGPLPLPSVAIPWNFLGLLSGPIQDLELDALSFGADVPQGPVLVFSVDEHAIGSPWAWPDVSTEGAAGATEASADVFLSSPAPWLAPPPWMAGPIVGNTNVMDGDGLASTSGSMPPGIGLVEPNPPNFGIPDVGDNLDALDDSQPTFPVFFSLDAAFADPLEPGANSGSAAANGFSGADVLVSPGGSTSVYAPAFILGLDLQGTDTDDLDALLLWDDGDLEFGPGDFLAFSVRRGSAVIGTADSLWGVPIEPGDVLVPSVLAGLPAGAPPAIAIFAEAIGLATVRSGLVNYGDDLDALDAVVPEPSSLSLLAGLAGFAALALWRRRSR